MSSESLSVTDNRTGQAYELPIEDGTVRGLDLRQIKVSEDDFGLMSYDPAFTNTASCRSSVTYIDGAAGILEHRGYSIEQLCERSSFLETAYLLIFGELPTGPQLDRWVYDITHHTFVHEDLKQFFEGFRYDAHPMGMLLAGVGALAGRGKGPHDPRPAALGDRAVYGRRGEAGAGCGGGAGGCAGRGRGEVELIYRASTVRGAD